MTAHHRLQRIIIETSGSEGDGRHCHEASADRPLPMREYSIRDHRSSTVGLHMPLQGLPAVNEQRLFLRDHRGGERPPSQRCRTAAWPIAVGPTRGWFAPNVGVGFAVLRGMAWLASGQARSTIRPGCGRPGISGPAASSPGSRLAKAIRFSRRSHPRSPAWAYRQTRISSAPPAIEAARRVPVKIDPLPAALDSDGSKPDHQPPSDPLSARRLGDKKIFKIHPGSAEPSREPGVERGKTGGLAVEKGEQPLESCPPDGVRLAGGSPEAGGTDLAPSENFLFRWD